MVLSKVASGIGLKAVLVGVVLVAGGIGGRWLTYQFTVEPLQAAVADLTSRLTTSEDNTARCEAAVEHVREQVAAVAGQCAQTVGNADQAAQDALAACGGLPEDATIEEWNAWLAACSPPAP